MWRYVLFQRLVLHFDKTNRVSGYQKINYIYLLSSEHSLLVLSWLYPPRPEPLIRHTQTAGIGDPIKPGEALHFHNTEILDLKWLNKVSEDVIWPKYWIPNWGIQRFLKLHNAEEFPRGFGRLFFDLPNVGRLPAVSITIAHNWMQKCKLALWMWPEMDGICLVGWFGRY